MAGRLAEKVAVITGTGGGQGREAAIRFAREGAKVVGCDLKVGGAEETVKLVEQAGGEMISLAPLDLADEGEVARLIDFAVSSFGDFDILWNNASAIRIGSVEEQSRVDFEFTLTNEVTILFLVIKHSVEVFKRKGRGVILNTGSIVANMGSGMAGNVSGLLSHSIAKAGVVRMSENLAVELSPWNIRVNSVSPGAIETPATLPMLGTEQVPGPLREHFIQSLLIPRIGRSEDIVNAAVYLVSDEAEYVTGINLIVDGGWKASGGMGQPHATVEAAMDKAAAAYAASGPSDDSPPE